LKVAIVDDNETVRGSLKIAFELFNDIEVMGEGGTGAEAIEICREAEIDVLLLDLRMPGMDGITVIHILHETLPHIRIVVLSSTTNPHLIQEALQAGASTFISKYAPLDELYRAIRTSYDKSA
jgi:DNA-binding NarL/FixJ family response regulator